MKAICDMTKSELASEYLYCLQASNDDILDPEMRSHYRHRVNAIYEYILELNLFSKDELDTVRSIVVG